MPLIAPDTVSCVVVLVAVKIPFGALDIVMVSMPSAVRVSLFKVVGCAGLNSGRSFKM